MHLHCLLNPTGHLGLMGRLHRHYPKDRWDPMGHLDRKLPLSLMGRLNRLNLMVRLDRKGLMDQLNLTDHLGLMDRSRSQVPNWFHSIVKRYLLTEPHSKPGYPAG